MVKFSNFIFMIRWTARIIGILLLGLFVLFFVGEVGFNPFRLSMIEFSLMTKLKFIISPELFRFHLQTC